MKLKKKKIVKLIFTSFFFLNVNIKIFENELKTKNKRERS
jgi:hypothetical protein